MNEELFKLATAMGVIFYLTAMLSALLKHGKPAYILFGMGFTWNILLIAAKWMIIGAPPFGTVYHVLSAVPLAFFPVALLTRRHPFRALPAVLALAAAIPLVGTLFMTPPLAWKQMPILQSTWFIPHVAAYCIGYGLCLGAFLRWVVSFVQLVRKKEMASADSAARMLVLLAFPLITFGLCSGALWGDSAWGSYWGWDPKENWGLITWLCYAIYLHLSAVPNLRRTAMIAHLLAFAALLSTLFMVAYTRFGAESKHFYGS